MTDRKLQSLIEQFFNLRGINLNEQELAKYKADFTAIAAILNLQENDEVFGFLTICEAYRALNEQEIEKTKQVFAEMADAARKMAQEQAKKAQKEIEATIGEAMREAARKARYDAKKSIVMWICAAVAVVSLAMAAVGWVAYQEGEKAGKEIGYQIAKGEYAKNSE